jgi:hypothetical protein
MDPVAEWDQVWAAWWQEKQDEVMDKSRCRVVAHDQSLHTGFAAFTTKPSVYLVLPQNEDWRLGGRRQDLDVPRSFDAGGHAAGSWGMRREDADCGECVTAS